MVASRGALLALLLAAALPPGGLGLRASLQQKDNVSLSGPTPEEYDSPEYDGPKSTEYDTLLGVLWTEKQTETSEEWQKHVKHSPLLHAMAARDSYWYDPKPKCSEGDPCGDRRFPEWVITKYMTHESHTEAEGLSSVYDDHAKKAKLLYDSVDNHQKRKILKLADERIPAVVADKGKLQREYRQTKYMKWLKISDAYYLKHWEESGTLAPNIAIMTQTPVVDLGFVEQYADKSKEDALPKIITETWQTTYIINVIGYGFDSPEQPDFKYFLKPIGRYGFIREDRHYELLVRTQKIFDKIFAAAVHQEVKAVILAGFGAGFFSEYLQVSEEFLPPGDDYNKHVPASIPDGDHENYWQVFPFTEAMFKDKKRMPLAEYMNAEPPATWKTKNPDLEAAAHETVRKRLKELSKDHLAKLEQLRKQIIKCREETGLDTVNFHDKKDNEKVKWAQDANVFKNWFGGDLSNCIYWTPGLKMSLGGWNHKLKEKNIKVGYMDVRNKALAKGFTEAVDKELVIGNFCDEGPENSLCAFSARAAKSDSDAEKYGGDFWLSNKGPIRTLEQIKAKYGFEWNEVALTNAWDPSSLAGNGNFRDGSLDGRIGRGTAVAVLAWTRTNPYLSKEANWVEV